MGEKEPQWVRLAAISTKYAADGYYTGELIPEKKVKNLRERAHIPENEHVFAVLDTSFFGSCKTGAAFCSS